MQDVPTVIIVNFLSISFHIKGRRYTVPYFLYSQGFFFGGCLGVDSSTREGYSVKKTVWHTVFSCKSVAPAKPGRMRGNAEAAVPPYNNMRLAAKVDLLWQGGRVRHGAHLDARCGGQPGRVPCCVGRCVAISAAFDTFGAKSIYIILRSHRRVWILSLSYLQAR